MLLSTVQKLRGTSRTGHMLRASTTSKSHYIGGIINDNPGRNWKDMSLDDKITEKERAMLAVWDYPVSDKYTRIWQAMQATVLPMSFQEALDKVLNANADEDDFALLGEQII